MGPEQHRNDQETSKGRMNVAYSRRVIANIEVDFWKKKTTTAGKWGGGGGAPDTAMRMASP